MIQRAYTVKNAEGFTYPDDKITWTTTAGSIDSHGVLTVDAETWAKGGTVKAYVEGYTEAVGEFTFGMATELPTSGITIKDVPTSTLKRDVSGKNAFRVTAVNSQGIVIDNDLLYWYTDTADVTVNNGLVIWPSWIPSQSISIYVISRYTDDYSNANVSIEALNNYLNGMHIILSNGSTTQPFKLNRGGQFYDKIGAQFIVYSRDNIALPNDLFTWGTRQKKTEIKNGLLEIDNTFIGQNVDIVAQSKYSDNTAIARVNLDPITVTSIDIYDRDGALIPGSGITVPRSTSYSKSVLSFFATAQTNIGSINSQDHPELFLWSSSYGDVSEDGLLLLDPSIPQVSGTISVASTLDKTKTAHRVLTYDYVSTIHPAIGSISVDSYGFNINFTTGISNFADWEFISPYVKQVAHKNDSSRLILLTSNNWTTVPLVLRCRELGVVTTYPWTRTGNTITINDGNKDTSFTIPDDYHYPY